MTKNNLSDAVGFLRLQNVTHFILNNQIFQMIFILSVIIVRYRKLNGDFFAAMNIFLYLCPQI